MNEGYVKYLHSQEWEEKRIKRIKHDKGRCYTCGTTRNLNVHHISYKRIFHEHTRNDLVTLCRSCHRNMHIFINESKHGKLSTDKELKELATLLGMDPDKTKRILARNGVETKPEQKRRRRHGKWRKNPYSCPKQWLETQTNRR